MDVCRRAVSRSARAIGVVLVLAIAGACSQGESGPDAPAEAADVLEVAGGRSGYSLGKSFEGLPLAFVSEEGKGPLMVGYGDCDTSEGGCAPPVQVQNWPACDRNPTLYDTGAGSPAVRSIDTVRGVPVYDFGQLEVFTGTTNIVILAPDSDAARRALLALRGHGSYAGVGAGDDLPPPVAGAVTGELACEDRG